MSFHARVRYWTQLYAAFILVTSVFSRPADGQIAQIEFLYNAQTSTGSEFVFAAVHIPGEFWVSEFNSSNMFRLSETGVLLEGPFTVPSLPPVFGMTWDGSLIWVASGSNILYGIDPTTKTITDSISIVNSAIADFVAFDATANGGQGAFWIGESFTNSSLYLIRYDGGSQGFIDAVLLADIPERTGCAVDNVTPGGPYLWFFHQSPPPGETQGQSWISLYKHPFLTGYSISVDETFGFNPLSTAAGGLFMTTDLVPGQVTLGGIHQATNDALFGVHPTPLCSADISKPDEPGTDATVNVFDLLELLMNWGTNGPGANIAAPTNIVDVFDLLDILAAWGLCP